MKKSGGGQVKDFYQLNQVAVYQYVLNVLYQELKNHPQCECCNSLPKLKHFLDKLCEHHRIKIKIEERG